MLLVLLSWLYFIGLIVVGIMIAMKPVGPLLAFVLGAIFTSFHESLLGEFFVCK